MAIKVERYMSDNGGLFETEREALQADLRLMLAKATDSDVFAKQAAAFIADHAEEIAAIVTRMVPEPAEPELPGLYVIPPLPPGHGYPFGSAFK